MRSILILLLAACGSKAAPPATTPAAPAPAPATASAPAPEPRPTSSTPEPAPAPPPVEKEPTASKHTIGGVSLSEVSAPQIIAALKKAGAKSIKAAPNWEMPVGGWQSIVIDFRYKNNDGSFALYRPAKSDRPAGWRTQPGSASERADKIKQAGEEALLYDAEAEIFVSVTISSDTKQTDWKHKLFAAVVTPPKS